MTRREWDNRGKKEKGQVKETYKGLIDKDNRVGDEDSMWEVVVSTARESNGGKIGTT